ncbi:MAG TPA: hypothetical protein PLY95_04125 [Candidatus Paceibacterota bacterium]|jgi:hypothetical protein|nr:hypothetical protein [Candidatus Paceibacterota bacterium]
MNKKTLTQVIGYEPSATMKKMILADVQASGKSLEECASAYALPVIVLPADRGIISECGAEYTVEQFKERFPFRKIVIIKESDL